MALNAEHAAAYRKLDEAVNDLHRILEVEQPDPPSAPTDYVLLVGYQYIDDDNDRGGIVCVYPKDGSQPAYITTGLLDIARQHIAGRGSR
jgi:hypothetical protein